jgi:poly-gamma-glutamate synthesis protein (capsule biosynthesis protein)
VNAGCRYLTALPALALFGWLAGAAHAEPLTMIFAGDIMLDDGPGRTIAAGGDPLAPSPPSWLQPTTASAISNVPSPPAARPAVQTVVLPRPADTLKILRGRFDAVSLANNHSGDYGPVAFMETLDYLAAAGIAHFGGGRNLAEAHRPLWIEKKGLKIAVLGYNEYKPRRFEAGRTRPASPGARTSRSLPTSAPPGRPVPTMSSPSCTGAGRNRPSRTTASAALPAA